jgi:3-dehydroquinate dehydratase-1
MPTSRCFGDPPAPVKGRYARRVATGLSIGALRLGGRPLVAVPFDDRAARAEVAALAARGLDVAELRVDLFGSVERDHVLGLLPAFAGVATLATIRSAAEGGGWKGPEPERLALYRALAPHVDAIDVEIASGIARDAIASARDAGKLAIASFHDFEKTPSVEALGAVVAQGRALGAGVVKIAAAARSPADLRALARVLVSRDDLGMIVIGMGAEGVASRVLFPALGSLLTYASVDRQTAPGQLPLDELVALLRRLTPG